MKKRQIAMLMALTVLVSLWATAEEKKAGEGEQADMVETEFVEQAAGDRDPEPWSSVLAEGEWMSIPEMQAEICLPAGWTLTEASETGFVVSEAAADGETPASISMKLEAFEDESLEAYAAANYETYELYEMFTGNAVVVGDEEADTRTMLFLCDGETLAGMTLTPASRTDLADLLPEIAETFTLHADQADADQADEAAEETQE